MIISNNSTTSFISTTDNIDLINTTVIDNTTFSSSILTQESEESTSTTIPITRFEHLSLNENQTDENILSSTTSTIDLFTFFNNQTENNELISTSSILPLNMTAENFTTTVKPRDAYYEYCKNKTCHHGGRLNSDCLCICLPTFTGDNCETGREINFFDKGKKFAFFYL